MKGSPNVANLEGEAALPRKNGELVFQAPWEGRAFGMGVLLSEKGAYDWDEFRKCLVTAVATGGPDYYESWLDALQAVLESRGLVTRDEVVSRASEYEALERDPVF
ncbi:MAG: nitrile hydratase accessory protein [Candidatus Dormibacteraeota bacterium]|nr:nitrile hydratase accessory protein [Candidatus Dormibacteraeota bacterium]